MHVLSGLSGRHASLVKGQTETLTFLNRPLARRCREATNAKQGLILAFLLLGLVYHKSLLYHMSRISTVQHILNVNWQGENTFLPFHLLRKHMT